MFNFVKVGFPSANVTPSRVSDMTLWQERYKHEFGYFQFRQADVDFDDIRPGTPVEFTINGDNGSRDYNAYVHHVEPVISPGVNFVRVHFIGASYYLKQTSQQVYKKLTADQIVVKIAKRNNFCYKAEPHPRVYDQVSQAGLTDMQMLQKLAKQCGYSLRITNSEIHFQPVTKLYDQERENAPIFVLRDANDPQGSTLYSFKPLIGESLDHDGEIKSAAAMSGVDKHTGKVIQLTNQKRPKATKKQYEPEFFDSFSTGVVVNDYDMAKNEAKSVDERTRFPYRATAKVLGDPNLHPDMPVYVDGVASAYAGYWVILKAEHVIDSEAYSNQRYVTILHLGTDSLGSAGARAGTAKAGKRAAEVPNQRARRTIIPNVRQTNKKGKTTLKRGTKNANKNSSVGFGKIGNRAKPKSAGKTIIATRWASTSGNLTKVTKKTGKSAVVIKKLRRTNG